MGLRAGPLSKAAAVIGVLSALLGFIVAGCSGAFSPSAPQALVSPLSSSPVATPTLSAADALGLLEAAVRATIASQVGDALESGLAWYQVSSSQLLGEGQFGRVEARIVLDGCPLFRYDLPYNGELKDGEWVLYNDAETLPNLFKSWATARSAALGGESVSVPGVAVERQISLIPEAVPELLQARLDGLSNPTVGPLVGFFVCEEQSIRWDELEPALADSLRELLPQVRELMENDLETE
jgi:hypothetical protein